jgi:hypothetical protein
MAVISWSVGRSRVRRLFAPHVRALPPAGAPLAEGNREDGSQSWLSDLSAPAPLAQWGAAFNDLSSCWNACRDPEWLLWLAARTCQSAEQQKQVVLCAAELASMAQRGKEADPRVTRAISLVQLWAESEADAIELFDAECDAVDAARESGDAADREARSARALFRAAPRRRASSSGMSGALGAWQRWRERERGRWLALAAASVVSATTLPGDATVTATEWANCVSQSAGFSLLAMSTQRPSGGRPSWVATRRSVRLARRRLACPDQVPAPAGQQGDDARLDATDGGERTLVAVPLQGQAPAAEGSSAESSSAEGRAASLEGDQRAAADAAQTDRDLDQDAVGQNTVGQNTGEQPAE